MKGLDNVVRYGIVSWAPVYYVQVGGFDLTTMAWVTFAYPVGYLFAPLTGGAISDRVFRSNRSIMIAIAGAASGVMMLCIAVSPADDAALAAALLFLGGFTVNLSPVAALAVDLAGRRLAGTASGVLDAHGYLYGGLQAWLFGLLAVSGAYGWFWVFAAMAFTRFVAVAAIWRVRA